MRPMRRAGAIPTQGSRADPDYGHLYRAIVEGLRPKSRSLWLTTATPMQLEAVEVADLLALTRRVGRLSMGCRFNGLLL